VIYVVSGPGGVGKGTLVDRLVADDSRLRLSRSWTTRPRRPGEPGDAYVFVDEPTFKERVAAGGFLEHTHFPGNNQWYGTPHQEVPAGSDLVLEIEVDGAAQVKKKEPSAVMILVVAPSREVQEERLRGRGDDEDHVQRRLGVADTEEQIGRTLADHVIVNDDLDRAVGEVAGIIARYRHEHGEGPTPASGNPPSNGD
jgi:guanylate kinase